MKLNKKYIVLIVILAAAIIAIIWTFATSDRVKSLLNPTETVIVDEEASTDQESPVQEDTASTAVTSSESQAAEINVSAEEETSSEPGENETDAPAQEAILDNDGELVIIVPEGEDTFGE